MILRIAAAIILFLHGLIHLIGVVVFLKIVETKDLPYSTKVLGGRVDIGELGTRILGVLWLVATIGYVIASYAVVADLGWWQGAVVATTCLSLFVTILGWKDSVFGTIFNVLILLVLALT